MSPWSPSIWRNRPAVQMPAYADRKALAAAEARLAVAAPVAAPADSARLRAAVAQAVAGGGFILQGGDCAESFDDAVGERVASLAALFDAMAESLAPALDGPLVEIARIAGQFAKPRTSEWEMAGDLRLPAYRGDIINGAALDPAERRADPRRMLRAHLQSVGSAASLAAARGRERPIYTRH